jgi:hypothetical protein
MNRQGQIAEKRKNREGHEFTRSEKRLKCRSALAPEVRSLFDKTLSPPTRAGISSECDKVHAEM